MIVMVYETYFDSIIIVIPNSFVNHISILILYLSFFTDSSSYFFNKILKGLKSFISRTLKIRSFEYIQIPNK